MNKSGNKTKQTEEYVSEFQLLLKQNPKALRWSARPCLALAPDYLSCLITHHTSLCLPATWSSPNSGSRHDPCYPRPFVCAVASPQNPLLLACHFLLDTFLDLSD